jgi:hypothetical protein
MGVRALEGAAWVSTFLLAAHLRLTNLRANVVGEEFVFNGPSTAFHARRMFATWANYPQVPDFDRLLDWPHGAVAPWPQGFDLVVATIALPASDRFEALLLISLAPVLLGLALVALVGWGMRVVAPEMPCWTAWVAATLVAIFPQSVSVTRFGNPDHHVAEAAILLGLGIWSVRIWRAMADGPLSPRRRLGLELGGAALTALSLSSHVATPAYAWIAGVSIAIANLRWGRGTPASWAVGAPALVVAAGVIALMYAPLVRAHGHALSWYFPSYLQPVLLVVAAFGFAGASLLGWTLAGSRRRLGVVMGATVVVLGGAALVPGVRASVAELLLGMGEWFVDRKGILGHISENLPLFSAEHAGGRRWSRAHAYYGVFGVLLPLIVPAALVAHMRRVGPWNALPFAVWTLGATVLMLQQNRFGRIGLVNLAMCSAYLLAAVVEARSRWRPLAAAAPVFAFVFDPAFHFYVRPDPPGPLPGPLEASVFLREHAPPPVAGNRSGVLTAWDIAFYVAHYAERGTTANGFVPYVAAEIFEPVQRMWSEDEGALARIADSRDLGWVLFGASTYLARTVRGRGVLVPAVGRGFRWNSDFFRRAPLAVMLNGGSGMPEIDVPHLRHLLPRFASTLPASGLPPSVPEAWVYERVRGAVVEGRAPPGARVRLRTGVARPLPAQGFVHEAWTRADAGGSFQLTTPVPTGYVGQGFATAPMALILVGDAEPRPLSVPEPAVRAGTAIMTDVP